MRAVLLLLAMVSSVAAAPLTAQGPVVLPRTEQVHLTSPVNGIEYRLLVSIPRDFATRDARYPVLYLLDADYSFAIARNVVEHLVDRGDLPPMVVVGIGYAGDVTRDSYRMHRSRDYTPTHASDGGYGPRYQEGSGGGPHFLRTIVEHVVPTVEERYRGNGRRVLVGHSYGGLFAVWSWATRPDLFGWAIAVSPSLWYDDSMMFDVLGDVARGDDLDGRRLYAMVGDHEINARWNMVDDLRTLEAILAPALGEDLDVDVADDETHNSVFPRALSNGLRFLWPRGSF